MKTNIKPTVFITGISGFIGSRLAKNLISSGYSVHGSSTQNPASLSVPYSIHQLKFGESIDLKLFHGIDSLIHTAHDPTNETASLKGTIALSTAAQKAGVKQEIYLSSYSALTKSLSAYADTKIDLERHFRLTKNNAIVRPGLVIGRGGLFGRMLRLLERFPLIPLPDSGKKPIPVVALSDLARALENLIEKKLTGEFNFTSSHNPTLHELMNEARQQIGRPTLFLPVPSRLALGTIRLLQSFGVNLPIRADNIAGFIATQGSPHFSHLKEIIGSELDLRTMVQEAIIAEPPTSN